MGAPLLNDQDEIGRMTEAKADAEREEFACDQDQNSDSRKVDLEALIERTTISDIRPALQGIAALPLESEREVFRQETGRQAQGQKIGRRQRPEGLRRPIQSVCGPGDRRPGRGRYYSYLD